MSGVNARLFYRSSTRNNKGIVEFGDLLVQAQSTPNGTVQVGDGAAIVRGAEVLWQGSYWAYNLGSQNVSIAPTTGTARSDLVWLRIEDPTFTGSPWIHNPATDVCASLAVTQNVGNTAVEIPSGYSGIPLARIDLPSTATNITSGMITDLRYMSDPRSKTLAFAMNAGVDNDYATSQNTYKNWPMGVSYTVVVPWWAAQCTINVAVYGACFLSHGGPSANTGTADAQGNFTATLGGSGLRTAPTPFLFEKAIYDPTNAYITGNIGPRLSIGTAGTLTIPASLRNTSQVIQTETQCTNNTKGTLNSQPNTVAFLQVIFNEVPVLDAGSRIAF